MSDPTPPAVSEAMREAVAREIAPRVWKAADELRDWPDSEYRRAHMMHCGPSLEAADRILSGPIASEIARLTGEREELASFKIEASAVLLEWEAVSDKCADLITRQRSEINRLLAALSRLQADRDAEVGKLRAALKLAENPLSYRNATDPNGPGSLAVARALEAVRAALTSQEKTDV